MVATYKIEGSTEVKAILIPLGIGATIQEALRILKIDSQKVRVTLEGIG